MLEALIAVCILSFSLGAAILIGHAMNVGKGGEE